MKISTLSSARLWTIILAVGICTSCGQRQPKHENNTPIYVGELATVIVPPQEETVPLDSFITDVEFMKLGKTGDILIGGVDKLWITEQHVIVADRLHSKAIFVFDREGNARTVINRLGRGPQEYTSLTDVTLTPDKEKIVVLDNHKKKLLFYNMNGDFLYDKDMPFHIGYLEYIDEQTIMALAYGYQKDDPGLASYEQNQHYVYVLDTLMNITRSSMTIPSYIKRFGDRVYVNPSNSDTVYRVTKGGNIAPQYLLDMSKIGGVANFGHEPIEKIREIRKEHNYFPDSYIDGKDFAIFRFVLPHEKINTETVLYDKHTGRSYAIEGQSSYSLNIYFLQNEYVHEDKFISVVPAFLFVNDNTPMKDFEKLVALKEGLTDEDNPVLLFYTLKEPDMPAVD